jgi:glycosyltransferase involved in cell wall biosynthesis
VDPVQDEQIANAMDELAGDEKRLAALKSAAQQRAALFSWERAAQDTLTLYEKSIATQKVYS